MQGRVSVRRATHAGRAEREARGAARRDEGRAMRADRRYGSRRGRRRRGGRGRTKAREASNEIATSGERNAPRARNATLECARARARYEAASAARGEAYSLELWNAPTEARGRRAPGRGEVRRAAWDSPGRRWVGGVEAASLKHHGSIARVLGLALPADCELPPSLALGRCATSQGRGMPPEVCRDRL